MSIFGFFRLWVCFTGMLVFFSNCYAASTSISNAESSASQSQTQVAQILVPEAVYAVQLLETLNLGSTQDDVQAEATLTKLGIEPKNGWISEYPVTPMVLGELDSDIALASEQGKIAINKEQAVKQVNELKASLGFNIKGNTTPAPSVSQNSQPAKHTIYSYMDSSGSKFYTDDINTIPPQYQGQAVVVSQTTNSPANYAPSSPYTQPTIDPNALNNYYQNQGPPILTYYAPPPDYSYLYSWVAYPFWVGGSYFPGYFMLNNFYQQVSYGRNSYVVSHHAGPAHQFSANQGAGGNWYPAGNAGLGARGIISNQLGRSGFQGQRPFQPAVNANNVRNNPVMQNNMQFAPRNQLGYANQAPMHQVPMHQGAYAQQAPQYNMQAPVFQQHEFSNHQEFGGGFNHGFAGGGGFAGGAEHMGGGRGGHH